MAKATLGQIMEAAIKVVEAEQLRSAIPAGVDTKLADDTLASNIYRLKWILERDRKRITNNFKKNAEACKALYDGRKREN